MIFVFMICYWIIIYFNIWCFKIIKVVYFVCEFVIWIGFVFVLRRISRSCLKVGVI